MADPQAGTVATPTGVRRWVSQPRSQVVTGLALSWFSVDDVLASREGIERVLDAFERHVPEAMPVRYGQWEPLSFRYADHGRQHLVDFLADEYLMPGSLGFALLKPKRPVLDVKLSLASNRRSPGLPWACHRVTVTLDAAVLDQGGWATALQRLWRRLTHDVQAFFADVRVIRGYRLGSGSEEEWRAAGRHPVCGGFWMGIPREPALALALGPPYLARWSEFSRVAEHEGTHALATPPRWTLDGDALAMVGPVPERLAKQCAGYAESGPNRSPTYPAEWPFGRPPTPGG